MARQVPISSQPLRAASGCCPATPTPGADDRQPGHGNTDAHAKNHSVFHAPAGDVSLTPICDVAATRAFIDQRHLALPVAGRFVIADITRDRLVRESVTWGIPERAATVTVTRVLDAKMEEGLRAGDSTFPSLDPRIRGVAVASMTRLALS